MGSADWRTPREGGRYRIAHAAVGQSRSGVAAQRHRRKQPRDGRARSNDLVQLGPGLDSRTEVARRARREIVADDAEAADAVVEAIESRRLELSEPLGDDAAGGTKPALEPVGQPYVEALRQKMAATKSGRIGNHLVHAQPDGCVVGRDHGAGAHADDRIDGNAVANELPQQPGMRRAAQAARTQHQAKPHRSVRIVHRPRVI